MTLDVLAVDILLFEQTEAEVVPPFLSAGLS